MDVGMIGEYTNLVNKAVNIRHKELVKGVKGGNTGIRKEVKAMTGNYYYLHELYYTDLVQEAMREYLQTFKIKDNKTVLELAVERNSVGTVSSNKQVLVRDLYTALTTGIAGRYILAKLSKQKVDSEDFKGRNPHMRKIGRKYQTKKAKSKGIMVTDGMGVKKGGKQLYYLLVDLSTQDNELYVHIYYDRVIVEGKEIETHKRDEKGTQAEYLNEIRYGVISKAGIPAKWIYPLIDRITDMRRV